MGTETACPDTSKFETFILLVQLVFELEVFKPPIGFSVFGSKIRSTWPIASKICTNNDLYVPHLSPKTQVSVLSRFKLIVFFTSVAELLIFPGKKRECRESPN